MKSTLHRPMLPLLLGLAVLTVPAAASADPGNPDALCDHGDGAKKGGKKAKHGKRLGKRFAKADKNGDGFITADEVSPERWERLSKADANGDAKVSKEELKAKMKDRMDKRRARKGGDGTRTS